MKIVLFACQSFVSDEDIKVALSTLGERIKVHILNQNDLFVNFMKPKNKPDSKFTLSVKKVIEACGDPTEEEPFRGKFYKLAYQGIIDSTLLTIISTGPNTVEEKRMLEELGCPFLPMIATAALTQLQL